MKNKTCIHEGCKTQPIFNVEGELERSLPERDKFFQDCSVDEPPTQLEENDAVGYYMQGVANEDLVVNLLPGQLGVLLRLYVIYTELWKIRFHPHQRCASSHETNST